MLAIVLIKFIIRQVPAMKVKEPTANYLTKTKKYNYQDYLNLPDDGKRYEVINGELIMVAAPNTIHQNIIIKIIYEIEGYLRKQKMGKIFCAPTDIKFNDTNVVQPDILFISQDRLNIITENNIVGAPDLIMEILSPGTAYYDLLEKKELYEQCGVKEYWIVDPKKQRVDIYINVGQQFDLNQRVELEGVLKSSVMKGFEVKIENIFSLD